MSSYRNGKRSRNVVLGVRLDAETLDGFRRCVEVDGGTMSSVVRDAIESAMNHAQVKAGEDPKDRRRETRDVELAGVDVVSDDPDAVIVEAAPIAPDADDDLAFQVVGGVVVGGLLSWLLGFLRGFAR